ncbi:MAG: glycerophosphodiester phosphodiesterase [Myxococcales bacterium]
MPLPELFRRVGRPFVLAHRGASAERPENTETAFQRALELGADGVELDVMRCGSGEVVVVHDPELSRLAGQPVQVAAAPWSVLRGLDVGSWFDRRFAGTRLLLLQEALELLGPATLVNVELKGEGRGDPRLAARVAGILSQQPLPERFLVSSFNPLLLRQLAAVQTRLAPSLRSPLALLFEPGGLPSRAPALLAHALGASSLHPAIELCEARRLSRWMRSRFSVVPWTVDEPPAAVALWEAGVSGVITNRPAELLAAFPRPPP